MKCLISCPTGTPRGGERPLQNNSTSTVWWSAGSIVDCQHLPAPRVKPQGMLYPSPHNSDFLFLAPRVQNRKFETLTCYYENNFHSTWYTSAVLSYIVKDAKLSVTCCKIDVYSIISNGVRKCYQLQSHKNYIWIAFMRSYFIIISIKQAMKHPVVIVAVITWKFDSFFVLVCKK